jgi:type VI secretion system protein ImpJ
MSLPLKILWSEGLNVGPQQFQQQDRYHEARLHQAVHSINSCLWGVSQLQWRKEDLANNCLRADAMSLMFQDGEFYDAPATDLLPEPVDLNTLPMEQTAFTFHVALPMLKPYGGNLHQGDGPLNGTRYAQVYSETADLFSESVSIDVAYLKQSVHLLSHLEPLASYVHFPVIRLLRVVGGGFEIDATFMPPSVSIGPASAVPVLLEHLLSKLRTKIESLYSRHRQPNKDVFEFHSGDVSSFLMLSAVSSATARLADFALCKEQHPRRLFEELLSFAGALLAFSSRISLADLPKYEHADPARHFLALDLIIRDLIDTVISSKYFVIALVRDETKSPRFRGALDALKIDQSTELCLAVNADMAALELVAAVPKLLKIGAPDDVEKIVASALPGIELVHMAQVPAAIPVRPNTYYFSIKKKGALYENMLKAQAIAIYAPAGLTGLSLELLAISA